MVLAAIPSPTCTSDSKLPLGFRGTAAKGGSESLCYNKPLFRRSTVFRSGGIARFPYVMPRGRQAVDVGTLLRDRIRDVPDFPKKGILFKDITTLLQDASA